MDVVKMTFEQRLRDAIRRRLLEGAVSGWRGGDLDETVDRLVQQVVERLAERAVFVG